MEEKRRVMVQNLDGSQAKECLKCGTVVRIDKQDVSGKCPVCGFDIDHAPQMAAEEFEREPCRQ